MISESYYWKSELIKYATFIEKSQCNKKDGLAYNMGI